MTFYLITMIAIIQSLKIKRMIITKNLSKDKINIQILITMMISKKKMIIMKQFFQAIESQMK